MSFFTRLTGQTPPSAEPETPAVEAPPQHDPAARLAEETAALAAALAAGEMAEVGRFVLDGSTTQIRQSAAEAITDPEQLRELIRLTRGGKDNGVYQILCATRDAHHAREREAEQRALEIAHLTAALERHAHLPYDPLFEPTFAEYAKRWHAIEPFASESARTALEAALAAAQAVIDRHHAAVVARAEEIRAAEAAALAAEAAKTDAERAAEAAALAEAERLAAEKAAADATREAERAAAAAIEEDVMSLLRQSQAAADRGGSARSARLREKLAKKLADHPALAAKLARQLEVLDTKIEELKAWREFTVAPKRVELLERMRSLIGAEIAPEALAKHIKKLQDEWRTLGRGAGETDESPEAEQFREAAHKAFEPCQVHFAKQAEKRKANAAQRKDILRRLGVYATERLGEKADWREVARVVTEAREEWRKYAPVDQSIAEDLQARFKTALDALYQPLHAEYDRNVAEKKSLIERAERLLALEDVRRAMDGAKELQRIWRTVGIVPREKDNALWETFRRHCNAVFERAKTEAQAFSQTLDTNRAKAEALCEAVEEIATRSGEALKEGLASLEAIYAEFEALELPRAHARELRDRWRRGARAAEDAAQREREAVVHRAQARIEDAASAIRAVAYAMATDADGDTIAALKTTADTTLSEIASAPKALRTALERHKARVEAGDFNRDLGANEAALRRLCVRFELLADVATPENDRDLRRQVQMQRLLESTGLGRDVDPERPEDLVLEWMTGGPVRPGVDADLAARIERCRAATRRGNANRRG